jgi:hypothetical protein
MQNPVEQFAELILNGRKAGRYLAISQSNLTLQVTFNKPKESNKYILQVYEDATWLWTAYDSSLVYLADQFKTIANQYI